MLRNALTHCVASSAACLSPGSSAHLPQSSLRGAAVRCLHLSRSATSRYDPRVFRDNVTDLTELEKPLSKEDDRNYLYVRAMESDDTPVFYRDHVVDKMVRVFMKEGRKETSRENVLAALELIKRRQYKAWKQASDEERKSIELDPMVIANKGIYNCRPLMKLLPMTRGGTTYQVPFPIEEAEAEFRAMKMMREVCREKAKHGATSFAQILASELMAASKNEGFTIVVKQELHKTCEANRAFIHYRG